MLVTGEDARWLWLSTGCIFCKRISCLVEMPRDVIEFEVIELVLQLVDFSAIHNHLGIVVAQLLRDLVDDQLGIPSNVEASNAQFDGNT